MAPGSARSGTTRKASFSNATLATYIMLLFQSYEWHGNIGEILAKCESKLQYPSRLVDSKIIRDRLADGLLENHEENTDGTVDSPSQLRRVANAEFFHHSDG
ncbi:hypothetical protein PDE_09246 [Penicillium oxalicum 114-2]|uniref:Uncharacterized protein n=1 Tax=Penicillium oxalicum (strain 114-2 / CGMCC 5302) TaxID=933388 RepID=S8BGP4_PENO1|nr:hypothetical protein PDE_09246 [Penicillium oxalicum 114-2]